MDQWPPETMEVFPIWGLFVAANSKVSSCGTGGVLFNGSNVPLWKDLKAELCFWMPGKPTSNFHWHLGTKQVGSPGSGARHLPAPNSLVSFWGMLVSFFSVSVVPKKRDSKTRLWVWTPGQLHVGLGFGLRRIASPICRHVFWLPRSLFEMGAQAEGHNVCLHQGSLQEWAWPYGSRRFPLSEGFKPFPTARFPAMGKEEFCFLH